MTDEKLKPCPFCECEMKIIAVGRSWWRIRPTDEHGENCPFGEEHEFDCSQGEEEWRKEHIRDWNRRAEEEKLKKENSFLSKTLKETQIEIGEKDFKIQSLKADNSELIDMLNFLVNNDSINDHSIEKEILSFIDKMKKKLC